MNQELSTTQPRTLTLSQKQRQPGAPRPAVVRQTLAILHDAYRELNSKRMFWITLLISGITIGAWSIISIGPTGLMLAGTDWESPYIPAQSQYKFLFTSIVIDWWLTWGVLILALISTAGIFPDFLSSGAVDLYIAKPISRLRLFLTKYVTGMLFAFLQVAIFSIVAFFVVGTRAHMWEPRLFMAIPITLCLFSYLYTIAALLGVMTRSTIATLMLTILMWGIIGGVHFGEIRLLALKNVFERRITQIDRELSELDNVRASTRPVATGTLQSAARMLGIRVARPDSPQRDRLLTRRENTVSWIHIFSTMHKLTYPVHLILPKTTDTAEMLDHELISQDEFLELLSGKRQEIQENFRRQMRDQDILDIPEEIDNIRRSRSTAGILVSSLAFEIIFLAWGAWLFCRRDF